LKGWQLGKLGREWESHLEKRSYMWVKMPDVKCVLAFQYNIRT